MLDLSPAATSFGHPLPLPAFAAAPHLSSQPSSFLAPQHAKRYVASSPRHVLPLLNTLSILTRRAAKRMLPLSMTATAPKNGVASNVALVALGCPKNTVDAEVMLGDLQKRGFKIQRKPEDADVVIVNTCAFIEDAKTESIQAVLEAVNLKAGGVKGVVVTGCMAQRYADELGKELPEIDAVIGFEHYNQIGPQIERIITASGFSMPEIDVGSTDVPFRPEWERYRITQTHSAFLRVAEGCDHKCKFCAIPSWRGKFRSKPFEAIMEEARQLVATGVTEINLIAEDTNQWGSDFGSEDPRRLSDLLAALAEIEEVRRMSLLYCYPSYFSEELIDAIANIDKVCKYIDIPLQHISERVLKAMNRPPRVYTENLLKKLRQRIPGLVLRTTFITGFPGETQQDHQELVDFVKEMRFERAGIFAYSEEEGTPAATLPDQVPMEVRENRRDELTGLVQDAQRAYAESCVGTRMEIVIDRPGEGGFGSVGRTRGDAPDIDCVVHLPQSLPPGTYVEAEIVGALDFDLLADAPEAGEATRDLSAEDAQAIIDKARG